MESGEPKQHVLALRRFLISSSSTSSTSSDSTRGKEAAGVASAPKEKRDPHNTSSVSSIASTSFSSATFVRNLSHHSTPPQTRLQYTIEKVPRASPPPNVAAGEKPRQRRSGSSDSTESHDYVDELASGAFRDCRGMKRTLLSTQQVLSFTYASPSVPVAATEGRSGRTPSPEEDIDVDPPAEDEPEQEVKGHGHLVEKELPNSPPYVADGREGAAAVHNNSEVDVNEDVGVEAIAETFYSPLTVTEVDDGNHLEEQKADVRFEEGTSRLAIAALGEPHVVTPSTMQLAQPVPTSPTFHNEDLSIDTTSSSRHQIGVWKAIYGRETWNGPRRSYSREEPTSEDATPPNTEDRDRSLIAAIAPSGAFPLYSENQNPSLAAAAASRRAVASQWAATRKTALETLRAQLDDARRNKEKDRGQETNGQRQVLPQPLTNVLAVQEEEPTILDAVVQKREAVEVEEDDTEQEEPFEIVEVKRAQPASPHIIADVTPAESDDVPLDSNAEGGTKGSALAAGPRLAALPNRQRRTAEEVLQQLFGGAPSVAHNHEFGNYHCNNNTESSEEVSNIPATSPLKSTPFSTKSSRLVVRPALSAEVSGISPIKNEAPSLLADLYDAPVVLRTHPTRSPLSPDYERGEKGRLRGRDGTISQESREEEEPYTLDMSAMDFRTAQTMPTSTPSSVMSDSPPMRPDVLYAVAHSPSHQEEGIKYNSSSSNNQYFTPHNAHDSGAVITVETSLQSNEASSLRPDNKVSVFPATMPNAWDVARANKSRSREQQGQEQWNSNATVDAGAASTSPLQDTNYNSNISPAAALRQERVRREVRTKELAECTFHPTLSPGTRAMVRLAQEREVERALEGTPTSHLPSLTAVVAQPSRGIAAKGADICGRGMKQIVSAAPSGTSVASTTLDPRTLKATLQNVYDRLYPMELSAAASRRQILDQEMEYRRLAREELILLRRKAGVPAVPVVRRSAHSRSGAAHTRDPFDSFMCSILHVAWTQVAKSRSTSAHQAVPTEASSVPLLGRAMTEQQMNVVNTSYMSPMAVALLEEREVKRKYNTRREAEMQQSHQHVNDAGEGETTAVGNPNHNRRAAASQGVTYTPGSGETFRIALFDEFLLRQNAYYFNRARTVQELERTLTPDFTPTTTHKSAQLVQAMMSRSLLNESLGPGTSSLIAQRQRQHIPIPASSFVTHHQSPYKDPCTFTPQLSPAARAEKAAEHKQQHSSNSKTPSAHRKAFFERLYGDHNRMTKERQRAKEAAAQEEMVGATFKPQLNCSRNAKVRSVLDPQNYEQYQRYLQKKRQSLEEQRRAQVERSGEMEEVLCTFRPQTTKAPAYISKMAKSFGVLRQQDAEF